MGFLRATIDSKENKYVVNMYFTWMYLGEQNIEKSFDSLEEAKDYLLNERCYNNLSISDSAKSILSYKDALKLQINKKIDNKKKF